MTDEPRDRRPPSVDVDEPLRQRIKARLVELDLNQTDLAEKIGASRAAVSALLTTATKSRLVRKVEAVLWPPELRADEVIGRLRDAQQGNDHPHPTDSLSREGAQLLVELRYLQPDGGRRAGATWATPLEDSFDEFELFRAIQALGQTWRLLTEEQRRDVERIIYALAGGQYNALHGAGSGILSVGGAAKPSDKRRGSKT